MNEILQRLEDKVITLVDEMEALRGKLTSLVQENHALKADLASTKNQTETEQEKLRGILNLLEGVEKDMSCAAPAACEIQ